MTTVKRHPLVAFFALTYLLTWSAVPFGSFFTAGPLLAAVIVTALSTGRQGFRELGSRLTRWRVSWVWYAAAVGLPLGVHALTAGLNLSLGAGPLLLDQFTPWSAVAVVFAVRLVDPLDGPLAEEPGWRAFAQPRLQVGRSPLAATLILGMLVTLWHLPLWLLPQFGASRTDIVADLVATMAVTVWYSWLFNHAGGSALLTLVAHAVEGTIQVEQLWPADQGADRATWLYGVVWCAVAAGLLVIDWRWWRGRGDELLTAGEEAQQEGSPHPCITGRATGS